MFLALERLQHLAEQVRLCWLIGRMKYAEQPISPRDGSAGRIDAVVPIVVCVAVALPQSFGRGIAGEIPQRRSQGSGGAKATMPRSFLRPPAACCRENAQSGLIGD